MPKINSSSSISTRSNTYMRRVTMWLQSRYILPKKSKIQRTIYLHQTHIQKISNEMLSRSSKKISLRPDKLFLKIFKLY